MPNYLPWLRWLIESGWSHWVGTWLAAVLLLPIWAGWYNYIFVDCYGFAGTCFVEQSQLLFWDFSELGSVPETFGVLDRIYVQRAKQAYLLGLASAVGFSLLACAMVFLVFLVFLVDRKHFDQPLNIEFGPVKWMVIAPLLLVLAVTWSSYVSPENGCAVWRRCDDYRYFVTNSGFYLGVAVICVVPLVFMQLLKSLCRLVQAFDNVNGRTE